MSQIQTKVLKQGIQHPKIISCSFFTMEDAYNKFEKYQQFLIRFFNQTKKFLSDFEVRVYTDDTGKDFVLDSIANHEHITVIHFDCPEFREGEGHIGIFGMFVRFLPLFEKHKTVWICDIDVPDSYFTLDRTKGDIVIHTQPCYIRKIYGRKYTVMAGELLTHVKFPKILLTTFFKQLLNGKFNQERDDLNKANKKKKPSAIPYGMDELWMNKIVVEWIKKQDLKISVNIEFQDPVLIRYIQENSKTDDKIYYKYWLTQDKKMLPEVKKIFKKWIPELIEKFPCLKELYEMLDDPKMFKNNFYQNLILNSSDL